MGEVIGIEYGRFETEPATTITVAPRGTGLSPEEIQKRKYNMIQAQRKSNPAQVFGYENSQRFERGSK